jgi:hypothetical protein
MRQTLSVNGKQRLLVLQTCQFPALDRSTSLIPQQQPPRLRHFLFSFSPGYYIPHDLKSPFYPV